MAYPRQRMLCDICDVEKVSIPTTPQTFYGSNGQNEADFSKQLDELESVWMKVGKSEVQFQSGTYCRKNFAADGFSRLVKKTLTKRSFPQC